MLYQLSVYALSQPKGSTAAILYPTTASTATRSLIEIREPSTGGTAGYVALDQSTSATWPAWSKRKEARGALRGKPPPGKLAGVEA